MRNLNKKGWAEVASFTLYMNRGGQLECEHSLAPPDAIRKELERHNNNWELIDSTTDAIRWINDSLTEVWNRVTKEYTEDENIHL